MAQRLSGKEKFFVYLVGVALGCVLLLFINRWRESDPATRDEKLVQNMVQSLIEGTGIRNLPEGSPEFLRQSELHAWHRTYPNAEGRFSFIWILRVEEGHPWIRVVEDLFFDPDVPDAGIQSAGFRMMRADQVLAVAPAEAEGEVSRGVAARGFALGRRVEGLDGWLVELGEHEVFSVPKAVRELSEVPDLSVQPYAVNRR